MSLRFPLRASLTSALAGALVGGLLAFAPAPAQADPGPTPTKGDVVAAEEAASKDGLTMSPVHFARSSYLCMGYTACAKAGYSSAGYSTANKSMYWRMYAGHNCTNYAAYRMVRSGLPNSRPWTGSGNATYWGGKMPSITNGTPLVGAVAWWRANTGPAGSAGHVAYVERVVSSSEIIISQDSWGGDFSWATVTKASGNWPSGFVHFNDVPLVNTAAPIISGYVKVGGVLKATTGTWNPTGAAVAYQWYANGKAIAGATAATLPLAATQLGQTITVRATASKLGYAAKLATSTATSAVLPGGFSPKVFPAVSGTARVDKVLTLSRGAWNVDPTSYRYQWYAGTAAIPGATGTSLPLTPDLAGQLVHATVTVARPGYNTVVATTLSTQKVALGLFTPKRNPSISGSAKPRQVMKVDLGAYAPSDAAATVQWLSDGKPVPGATGATYVVRPTDLGHQIRARVTLTRAGYQTTAFTTLPSARVRATPTVRVKWYDQRHGAAVTVRVTSPFFSPVAGTIEVRVKGAGRVVATLHNGVARVRLPDLQPGVHKYLVVYRPTSQLERGIKAGNVRLR